MAEFRLSPAAERDLESIWKYTRREWGLEQAERETPTSLTAAFLQGGTAHEYGVVGELVSSSQPCRMQKC